MVNHLSKGFMILPEFGIYDPIAGKMELVDMSEEKQKRYDVCTPVEYKKDGKDETFFQKIGTGFPTKNDGISVSLNALPVNGKILLFVHKDKKD
jgi:hypothetical protein